mmetsp:Transcript_110387/g.268353  ORF Transcript_110387/g.268353 Transcript_110387/m.268353 type:complete len:222 (-) Transcript_110387:86-751(-)
MSLVQCSCEFLASIRGSQTDLAGSDGERRFSQEAIDVTTPVLLALAALAALVPSRLVNAMQAKGSMSRSAPYGICSFRSPKASTMDAIASMAPASTAMLWTVTFSLAKKPSNDIPEIPTRVSDEIGSMSANVPAALPSFRTLMVSLMIPASTIAAKWVVSRSKHMLRTHSTSPRAGACGKSRITCTENGMYPPLTIAAVFSSGVGHCVEKKHWMLVSVPAS